MKKYITRNRRGNIGESNDTLWRIQENILENARIINREWDYRFYFIGIENGECRNKE